MFSANPSLSRHGCRTSVSNTNRSPRPGTLYRRFDPPEPPNPGSVSTGPRSTLTGTRPVSDIAAARLTGHRAGPNDRHLSTATPADDVFTARGDARFADCRFSNYRVYDDRQAPVHAAVQLFAAQLDARISAGDSLLLWGSVGTGKDHLLSAMIHRATERGVAVRWEHGVSLAEELGEIRGSGRLSAAILDRVEPPVLAISEVVPAAGELTASWYRTLFRIVDLRYRRRQPTWLTLTVCAPESATTRLGSAIVDRLRDGGLCLGCHWPSYRSRRSSDPVELELSPESDTDVVL